MSNCSRLALLCVSARASAGGASLRGPRSSEGLHEIAVAQAYGPARIHNGHHFTCKELLGMVEALRRLPTPQKKSFFKKYEGDNPGPAPKRNARSSTNSRSALQAVTGQAERELTGATFCTYALSSPLMVRCERGQISAMQQSAACARTKPSLSI